MAIIAPICTAIGIFYLSFSYFQSEEVSKARGRLSLFRSTVVAELERFSHLTYILARDPFVIETARGGDTTALNVRLSAFAEQAGLDAIYLMRPDGETVAASNAGTPGSFVGQNYSFRPYFRDAVQGAQGRFYGIGTTTGLPGYFIADSVLDDDASLVGVIAIKLDLTKLEAAWRAVSETVFLANNDGVILLSSNPDWRYRVLNALGQDQRDRIGASQQFTGQPLDPLDWQTRGRLRAVIAGRDRIHLTTRDLPHTWELHYFASDDRAVTRSWLVTGTVVILAAMIFIISQSLRTRRIGAALRRSEAEEAQLRQANERLAVEIEERKTAERRLKRTQDELERASRLAALGQLAASVTHELGQPIAAMRNHLAAAELNPQPQTAILPRVAGLVDRMEGITRQLKFFARTDTEEFSEVDLRAAMQASLALVAPNISGTGARLTVAAPDQPVLVRGNQLRLEQVMTNVLRNAIDAMEDCDDRHLDIEIGQTGMTGWFEVRDSGHGLGDTTLSKLQEPFVTTRESGRGMGLGLAISADIVKEHRGSITARNRPEGGALFRVEIPMNDAEDQSAG